MANTPALVPFFHRVAHRAAHAAAAGRLLPALALAGALLTTLPAYAQEAARPGDTGATAITGVEPGPLVGRPVSRVEIVGVARSDARGIIDQLRVQAGQNYQPGAVNDDLRTLAATERFLTVRADIVPTPDNRVVVRYIVEERPIVSSVEIRGNRSKKTEEIRELIATAPGAGVNRFVINTDIQAIEEFYRRSGYASARVSIDEAALRDEGIVRFEISEGPRSRVKAVRFDGNASIKSNLLAWKVTTKPYIWILRKGILDEDRVEQDIATIRETYVSRGYLDARVSRSIEYSADKKNITVRFIINEGPRYKVGNVNLQGNTVFATADLLRESPLVPGEFVSRDAVETVQRRIEDRYGSEGYINRTVDVRTAYTDQPGVVDINITIAEGEPYAAGQIIIRGNPTIQDRVIRRQIRIYPDQTIDTTLIRKSIDRLRATRLFSDVKITPIVPSGNPEGIRDLLVEVQEGQTGRFLIGAGLSSSSGVIGQFSIEQQNFDITNPPRSFGEFLRGQSFKGAGQFFRILLEPGTEVQRYRLTFEEPYLFDTPYSLANDLYYFTRGRESYDERRIGDILTLGRRFGDVWSVSLAFRAEQVNIKSVDDFGTLGVSDVTTITDNQGNVTGRLIDAAQEIIDEEGSHFLTSIKPAIIRDTTDSRVFPSAGTRSSLAWEQYGIFGGDVEMSKIVFRFDWFYTLHKNLFDHKTVFSLRNEFGYIVSGDSPVYERFYGGGIGGLRGFRFRGVGPRSGPPGFPNEDPIGGDFSWVTTAEVNYPIWEETLRGVVFLDVGTVEEDIGFSDIRADIGAGIRLQIPFLGSVPLALDFAIPIAKKSGDRTQIVSFALGIPF